MMRFIPVALALAAFVGLSASSATAKQPSVKEKRAVDALVDGFARSWNSPGMPGLESLFWPDADFVVITGKWLKGRDEIVSYHRQLLSTFYKGSHVVPQSIWVRTVHPGVTVVHVSWRATYTHDGKTEIRTALMSLVVTQQRGSWRIASVHNTLTSGPDYAFGTPPTTN
jgi:uncharacterized protein (TIGR02246 family)